MSKRTSKQLRADLTRIKLEGKSLKKQMQTIAKQYLKMGKTLPKKLQEERATQRDIRGYMKTLINILDNKIEKREIYQDNGIKKSLNELNKIQRLRYSTMANELQGYDKQFIKEFLNGKVAVLGRHSTTSVVPTTPYNMERIIKLAQLNKVSPLVYIKQELEAMKKDINDFKGDNPKKYIMEQIDKILTSQGYNLTEKNKKDIENKLAKVDWLGGVRIINSIESRIETKAYEIYKGDWDMYHNRKLMEIILDDIKRGSHNNMVQHVRLID